MEAAIAMLSPVRGLRRLRGGPDFVEKVPKPAIATVSSPASASGSTPALDMNVWKLNARREFGFGHAGSPREAAGRRSVSRHRWPPTMASLEEDWRPQCDG